MYLHIGITVTGIFEALQLVISIQDNPNSILYLLASPLNKETQLMVIVCFYTIQKRIQTFAKKK